MLDCTSAQWHILSFSLCIFLAEPAMRSRSDHGERTGKDVRGLRHNFVLTRPGCLEQCHRCGGE